VLFVYTRVVDEYVQVTKPVDDRRDHVGHGIRILHIGPKEEMRTAWKEAHCRFGSCAILVVVDRDASAMFGELAGDGASKSSGSSRD
jgi:hypothetical protein